MKLRDRIGIDLSRNMRIEDGVIWASKNEVKHLDIQLDNETNDITSFDAKRISDVRSVCEKHGIAIGLHTSSAVNVAEYAPHASDGVDEYLKAYVDIYPKLGAEWIVVHAGYHFTKDKETRMKAGLERLKRIADYAEKKKALLLLENLNKEPEDAEVHYLAHARGMAVLLGIARVAVVQAFIHGEPCAPGPGGRRRFCRRARFQRRLARCGWPTASATATRCISNPAPATSTSSTCSGASKAKDSRDVTPMPSVRSRNAERARTLAETGPRAAGVA